MPSDTMGMILFLFVLCCCLFVLWLLFRPKPIKYLLLEQVAEGWQVLAIFYVTRDYVGQTDETVDEFLKQFIAQKCPSNDTLWIIVDETLRFTRARFFSPDPRSYWAGIDYGNTGNNAWYTYSVNLEYVKQEPGGDGVAFLGVVTESATHALQTFLASHSFWDKNLYRWHLFHRKAAHAQKKLVASGPGPAFLQRTESGGLVGCGKSLIAQVGTSVQS